MGRRQSAVEVAGGYVLDYIRWKRKEREAATRLKLAELELEAARQYGQEVEVAGAEAGARLDAYVQAAIDAE